MENNNINHKFSYSKDLTAHNNHQPFRDHPLFKKHADNKDNLIDSKFKNNFNVNDNKNTQHEDISVIENLKKILKKYGEKSASLGAIAIIALSSNAQALDAIRIPDNIVSIEREPLVKDATTQFGSLMTTSDTLISGEISNLNKNSIFYAPGCVPAAFSSIMSHHKFPHKIPALEGVITINNESFKVATKETNINWSLNDGGTSEKYLKNNVEKSKNNNLKEVDSRHELMRSIGIAGNAAYTEKGTGIKGSEIDSITEKFGYKFGDLPKMNDMINEIKNGNPVFMIVMGVDKNNKEGGGHAFIADGVGKIGDSTAIHFNMGWDGKYNGWYMLNEKDVGEESLAIKTKSYVEPIFIKNRMHKYGYDKDLILSHQNSRIEMGYTLKNINGFYMVPK